ncbi:hypothetical protein FRC18_007729 [Serendipita sp. 400]|nr:hypothetical protein FRC18_007729 [Serendipita sp. 400]
MRQITISGVILRAQDAAKEIRIKEVHRIRGSYTVGVTIGRWIWTRKDPEEKGNGLEDEIFDDNCYLFGVANWYSPVQCSFRPAQWLARLH